MRQRRILSLYILFIIVTIASCILGYHTCYASSAVENVQPYTVFSISKGINLTNWFSQAKDSTEYIDERLTHADIDAILKYGFDHVRIPIDESYLFNDNGEIIKERHQILDDRISYAINSGLKVILDLHICRVFCMGDEKSILFTTESGPDYLINIWEKLQKLYSKYPTDKLAYECLNEPAAAHPHHDKWNNLLKLWIKTIRKNEKNRVLFCGLNAGNQVWTLKYLKLPKDPFLVLTFHYYQPAPLTHYKASWHSVRNYNGKVNYPGELIPQQDYRQADTKTQRVLDLYEKKYDINTIRKEFEKVVRYASDNHIQVNLGEFGCLRTVPDGARYRWLSDITTLCEDYGFSYTLWGHKDSGFGIYGYNRELDTQMLKAIKVVKIEQDGKQQYK